MTSAQEELRDDVATDAPESASLSSRRDWPQFGTAAGVAIACVVLVGAFTVWSPGEAFFSVDVFQNVAATASTIVLLTVAQAMLLGAGQLDISQGAIAIIASVFGGKVTIAVSGSSSGMPTGNVALGIAAGIVVGVLVGAAAGFINGMLVGGLGLNSLVVTLATLGIATGLAEVVTKGVNLSGLPLQMQTDLGIKTLGRIPLPAIVAAALVIAAWAIFYKTRVGLHTLAIGSNRSAAERGGIRTGRHIVKLFVFSGLMSGIAGLITLTRFATTDIGGHQSDALAALAGAVIGGTRLTGGRTSIGGAVLGALLAVILQIGLVVVNVDPFYQTIAIGLVLLIAITIDRLREKTTAA